MIKNNVSNEVVGRVLKLFLGNPTKFLDYTKIRLELPNDSESSIRRALQKLGNEGILHTSNPSGKQKSNDKTKLYKISMKPIAFEKILNISLGGYIDDFLRSGYVEHFIRINSFEFVYDAIKEKLKDAGFKWKASSELFALKSTRNEYVILRDMAIEYYNTYKIYNSRGSLRNIQKNLDDMELIDLVIERLEHHFFDEPMAGLANRIGINIIPIKNKRIEILNKFETSIAIPFYRNTIHKDVKKLFSDLNKSGLITFGLSEFMKYDNYLSPFTSYPTNNPEVLLFSEPFKRIYENFYLMNKLDLKKLFKRASTVYIRFADLLFEHFRYHPPHKHALEIWTKQFIFQWNSSAQNFDIVWDYLNDLYRYKLGSGKYHVHTESMNLYVIDLETNQEVCGYQEIMEEQGISQPFDAPFLHHLFVGLETDIYDPYTNLLSCWWFENIEDIPSVISYDDIILDIKSKFSEYDWDYYM
jgi:hypothetical protein